MLLDGLNVSPLKWRVCGCGLNRFVHEGMNHISNVEVHLKTRSGNVNIRYKMYENYQIMIYLYLFRQLVYIFYPPLFFLHVADNQTCKTSNMSKARLGSKFHSLYLPWHLPVFPCMANKA